MVGAFIELAVLGGMSGVGLAGLHRRLAFCRRFQLRDVAHTRVDSSK